MKYKKINFKELSQKYEEQAKHHSHQEQEKTEKRKKIIVEKEKQRNLLQNKHEFMFNYKERLSSNNVEINKTLWTFDLKNEYMKKLMKKVKDFEDNINGDYGDELDRAEAEKLIENMFHAKRLKKERDEIAQLLYKFKEYYYRDYHYIYVYPYEQKRIKITCFKENEELKENTVDSEILEKDYLEVYRGIKLLSIKNLQRYDCWPDMSPDEWLKICSEKDDNEYHGRSPNYSDGK